MNTKHADKAKFTAGSKLLSCSLLPLVRLVYLLYLTGPFIRIEEVLEQLHEPLDTAGIHYPDPGRLLAPHLEALRTFEEIKHPGEKGAAPVIINDQGQPLPTMEAVELRVNQAVLEHELEEINSLLCGPCGCSLCCTGPAPGMKQLFFEIPLQHQEVALMGLEVIDTPASREVDSSTEPPLKHQGTAFYRGSAAIYHWRSGWSMILPRNSRCPQLAQGGGCRIYPQRPKVCRRPQIFAYILEDQNAAQCQGEVSTEPVYRARNKLLAVWDCPYVRSLQDEIVHFAESGDLEPIFRSNKD